MYQYPDQPTQEIILFGPDGKFVGTKQLRDDGWIFCPYDPKTMDCKPPRR